MDDCSINEEKLNIDNFSNIKSLKIIKLKENLGSQKAIAVGLKYLESQKKDSIITVMDSDGEDDFTKINKMVNLANENRNLVVVSCRIKEEKIFSVLYNFHKLLTFIFTLQWINFGNYSSFHSLNISNILKNNYAWLAYSSAVIRNCKIKKVYASRKKRFFGKSKLTSFGLFIHSLRVNLVFFNFHFFIYIFILSINFFIILILIYVFFYY